jgi:hypothetical protein
MVDSTPESGWTEHERQQRQAWLRLTSRQRLDWLWQARSFALRAEEARLRPSGPTSAPPDANRSK